MLAVIGGSGLSGLGSLEVTHRRQVRTPYGEPSGPLVFGNLLGRPVAFLARHGEGHTIPPHEVNYRANLWALRDQGAGKVVSVAAVGGIGAGFAPGTIAIPDQIIDYTWGRRHTVFEDGTAVTHIDFTEPYARDVRASLLAAARSCGEAVVDRAVYAVTQGPRLETAAEIGRLERDGADVVGMTAMPEAALARELDLRYAAIAVVANFAAGRGDSRESVSMQKIETVLGEAMTRVQRIIEALVKQ